MTSTAVQGYFRLDHRFEGRLFRDTWNALRFQVDFAFAGGLDTAKPLMFEAGLTVVDGQGRRPLVEPIAVGSHAVAGNRGRVKGTIKFRVPSTSPFAKFTLELAPHCQERVTFSLGERDLVLDQEKDVICEMAATGRLMKLPRGWPLVAVSDSLSTNIVPAAGLEEWQSETRAGSDRRSSQLLTERLAALTAIEAKSLERDAALWVWRPGARGSGDARADAIRTVSRRWSELALAVANDVERIHGLEHVNEASDAGIHFAFFQTEAFAAAVRAGRAKGLCLFGFKDAASDDVRVVLDLGELAAHSIPPATLAALLRSSDEREWNWRCGLAELAIRRPAQDAPFPSGPATAPRFANRRRIIRGAHNATRRGVFLNSEPRVVSHWIDLAELSSQEDLLIAAGIDAAKQILSRVPNGEAIPAILGLFSGVADEFSLARLPDRDLLDLDLGRVALVNRILGEDGGEDMFEPPDILSAGHCRVVVLTPIDTYVRDLDDIVSRMTREGHEIVGVVALISVAESRPLAPDSWHADFFPVLRLGPEGYVLNPRLSSEVLA